jgi:hypothetical protein
MGPFEVAAVAIANPFPEDFEAAIKEMKRATNQNLELWYRSLYLKWLSIELKTPRLWFTS